MPTLSNYSLEKQLIRSICHKDKSVGSYILASLNEDDFFNDHSRAFYKRIAKLSKHNGEIPDWDDLLDDVRINEDARKAFQKYDKRPLGDRKSAQKRIQRAHEFRKLRKVYQLAIHIDKEMKNSELDVEELLDYCTNELTSARTTDMGNVFTNIGKGNNADKLVKKLLKGEALDFIPTGIKTFDDVNRGIPRGGLWLLAATTGGGKSTVALNVALNQARMGYKVGFVSLEMNKEEVMLRHLANKSKISMTKLIDPVNKLTEKERKLIWKAYKKDKKAISRISSVISYVTPDQDFSIEETLFMLKPYGFDMIYIDYISLLKGMRGEDQWRHLTAGTGFGKRYAAINGCGVAILAQLSAEGLVRYARGMVEDASNAWIWNYNEDAKQSHIIEVQQPKARSGKQFSFPLQENFDQMTVMDLSEDARDRYMKAINNSKHKKKDSSSKTQAKVKQEEDDYMSV